MDKKISVSIGIFAHNEENNIKKILNSIEKQKTDIAKIKEIMIVSSGSTDKTDKLIRQFSKKDKRIKFLQQFKREGKASAINLFIRNSHAQILVIISSDLRLHSESIEEITLPFIKQEVGMVGAHPIPCNTQQSEVGKEVALLWHLHHLVSLHAPKCGEMVAFRSVVRSIPKQSAVDEATLEVLLKLIGFKVVYAPRAIVFNKAAKTVNDFILQRRRIYAGHLWLQNNYHYQVSTMNSKNNFEAILTYFQKNPEEIIILIKLIILEIYSRFLGWVDYNILGKNPYIWKMVER
ncbi:glycosyltransferase [Candidatus Beckwithbacteria bacterium]|nr:glycosyltransferase [Candidatus Beckwithbacteria bacterium]